jgi:hypothetical protein
MDSVEKRLGQFALKADRMDSFSKANERVNASAEEEFIILGSDWLFEVCERAAKMRYEIVEIFGP